MSELPQLPLSAGHRDRLVAGMAAAVRAHGYRDSTVTEVVAHARTSRRSFYEQFEDREACYLALFDVVGELLVEAVAASVDPAAGWEEQVDQALGTYVDAIASEPELTVSFIREVPALGAVGTARQRDAIESFARLLMRLASSDGMQRSGVSRVSMATAVLLVGGLRELVAHAIEHDEPLSEVRAVASDVIKSVLDPGRVTARAPH
ncbi:TetR/AcrR family transcriptional regulator [Conexibacter woesei]|nr:TetR/AcrR family transcriptional regulator [Conexibacter woesei]